MAETNKRCIFADMEKSYIINAWNKAEKTAQNQMGFVEIIDKVALKDETKIKEELIELMKKATDKKCNISESFQTYFSSYATAAFRESEYSYNNPTISNLIPAVFLLQHSLELFIKFIKMDSYTWFGTKKKSVDSFFPANIRDLDLNKHNIIDVFEDEDCIKWFSYIKEGERLRKSIKRKYSLICNFLGENDLAVNMRYPMSNGYKINDYSHLTAENVQCISSVIMDLIGLCVVSDICWAKDEEEQDRFKNDVLNNKKEQ